MEIYIVVTDYKNYIFEDDSAFTVECAFCNLEDAGRFMLEKADQIVYENKDKYQKEPRKPGIVIDYSGKNYIQVKGDCEEWKIKLLTSDLVGVPKIDFKR